VTVTDDPMSAGFYEAVVRSLAEGEPGTWRHRKPTSNL
jgi:hypothetical protein